MFYTAVIGSGAAAPVVYSVVGDHLGQSIGVVTAALTALATVPLVLRLRASIQGA